MSHLRLAIEKDSAQIVALILAGTPAGDKPGSMQDTMKERLNLVA